MKERESLSILLLFPARTLKFNINIIRKIKGKAVNSNLKTSVYTFITCKLIKKKRIHNTMKTEIYFLKVLLLCIVKKQLCSDGKHNTMGKKEIFSLRV